MQVFNNFFEILLAPMEPKNLILLNFPKKAYHAHPPPHPHSEEYSPMVLAAVPGGSGLDGADTEPSLTCSVGLK